MNDFDPLFQQLDGNVLRDQIPKPRYFHILSALHNRPWAILAEELELMNNIVADHLAGKVNLEAVAAKLGRPLENTGGQVSMRGSTAILAIEGPIFRYANLMTALSGATSVESAAVAFDMAVENPAVSQIILHINSPGGEVDGINSFADQIRAGAIRKPVTAFVDGWGASAAYWLASAARTVVADESAQIGSIGVVATQTDRSGAQERQGIKSYKIVSSQSPRKQPDAGTTAGRGQLQEMVDQMAGLFIDRVAQFRGITADQVASDFGQGGVMMAREALQRGMIDGVGSFEPFLATLEPRPLISIPAAHTAQQEVPMADVLNMTLPAAQPSTASNSTSVTVIPPPLPVAAPAPQTERERIRAILESPEAQGREDLAKHLALETDQSPASARLILSKAPVAVPVQPVAAPRPNAFEQAMAGVPNPVVGVGGSEEDQSVQAEAARVLRWVKPPAPAPVN